MKISRRQFMQLTAGAAVAPALSTIASAQTYPTRPVRVIVPYAAAGPTDMLARLTVQKLSEHLGKQFYVENIGGAGGNIGMGQGARAAPDGYTSLWFRQISSSIRPCTTRCPTIPTRTSTR
jgi:tripartite-type tricarboxylate transporter receptor subunit TctC